MTTLYLVRHGLTEDNDAQLLQGISPGKLNAAGVAQMERLADELCGQRFDAIIASDLQRAIDSAHIIARGRGQEVATTPLLRERDWGDFTGRFIPDLKDLPFPANVESLNHLLDRARQFIVWVQTQYPSQTVLAVGHGIINKAVQAVHYGKPMRELNKMGNAECRILHLDGAAAKAVPEAPDAKLNLK
ncbi:MAG: histidine phosphatase family protein [Muribaculaceae bacterium]|nr:histidine phosphatase family protein [Muribaculaceae bacterium]